MNITWHGHTAIELKFGTAVLLIDPFSTGAGRSADDLAPLSVGCTHVLLTHGHDDHVGNTVAICRATRAELIGALEVCM